MKLSVIVPIFGDLDAWRALAQPALRSAGREADEVVLSIGATLREARNGGASMATGDRLCFLDADDTLREGFGAAMRAAPDADVLVPAMSIVYRGRASAPAPWVDGGSPFERPKSIVGSVIRAEAFWRLGGFPDREPWGEDLDLWLAAKLAPLSFASVPEAVYEAHWRDGSRGQYPRAAEVWDAIVAAHGALG